MSPYTPEQQAYLDNLEREANQYNEYADQLRGNGQDAEAKKWYDAAFLREMELSQYQQEPSYDIAEPFVPPKQYIVATKEPLKWYQRAWIDYRAFVIAGAVIVICVLIFLSGVGQGGSQSAVLPVPYTITTIGFVGQAQSGGNKETMYQIVTDKGPFVVSENTIKDAASEIVIPKTTVPMSLLTPVTVQCESPKPAQNYVTGRFEELVGCKTS